MTPAVVLILIVIAVAVTAMCLHNPDPPAPPSTETAIRAYRPAGPDTSPVVRRYDELVAQGYHPSYARHTARQEHPS